MAQVQTAIPKGTRDFSPIEMARRNYIFDTIKSVFKTFGYAEIQTPAMENLNTLLGKYGEEGDKLLFRILNSGDAFAKVDFDKPLQAQVTEKGLRYDLTVPFARFVVQHREEISLPFKRFQIQPVYRADRPQKGRYREFYQCDIDVVGSKSLLYELEMIQVASKIFEKLDLNVAIKVNNRKVLSGMAEIAGQSDKVVDITVAIDKIDKIGLEAVQTEMRSKGLTEDAIATISPILTLSGSNAEKLSKMKALFEGASHSGIRSEEGLKGVAELEELFALVEASGVKTLVELDLSLARGLNYYTGAIFEIKALDYQIGSISGGGRYDNLTGIFGLKDVSGVGISFGADRIYDCLLGLDKFPATIQQGSTLLFANMGSEEAKYVVKIAAALRERGVSCEIYPENSKLKKQFDYADAKAIPFISISGSSEKENGTINIKNLATGSQETFSATDIESIISFLK
ncbi:MAG: histidine--tRNA ligase [Bacteroidales bacterium]|nr:histidine--tRNA ligase [Bacteroidales bacterium]